MSPKLKEKIREEATSFFIIFLYCWAILGLLAFHKSFLLAQHPFSGQLLAIVNALVLGKVIITLEFFQVVGKFEDSRPITRALIRAVIFGLFLFAFRFVEEVVRGWFHGKAFSDSLNEIDNGKLMVMVTMAIIMIVALVPYFALREIAEIVGGRKLLDILFKPRVGAVVRDD